MDDSMKKRVGIYGGMIIISDGEIFQAFGRNKQYNSLQEIMDAIDSGEIDNGIAQAVEG